MIISATPQLNADADLFIPADLAFALFLINMHPKEDANEDERGAIGVTS